MVGSKQKEEVCAAGVHLPETPVVGSDSRHYKIYHSSLAIVTASPTPYTMSMTREPPEKKRRLPPAGATGGPTPPTDADTPTAATVPTAAAPMSAPSPSPLSVLPLEETASVDGSVASVDGSAASDTGSTVSDGLPVIAPAAGYTHAWARRLFSCYDEMPDDWELDVAPPTVLTGATNAELEEQASAVIADWIETGAAAAVVVPLCPCGASGWLRDLLLVARALAVIPSEEVPLIWDTCHPAAVLHLQSGDEHAETDTVEDRGRWVHRRLHRDGPRGCALLTVSLPSPLRPAACVCRNKGCPGCTVVSDVLWCVARRQWHRIGAPQPSQGWVPL